ncbi:MAG: ribonucleoside-triphosphate reductase activating protein [Methanosphaera sp. rholeuAM130]|nr:4Fe-4S single cluster domain-containing protein [Methanosphaera sp.]RAP54455.1 MAG: ribonucleoside-triphosphate reductase activating protein [Methanosphaera sp. rholeuAM130]
MNLHVNEIIHNTRVEGPGIRTCIFLQGCLKHCYKCNSPQTWDLDGGDVYDVESLAKRILENDDIEGVTFSGGEPFLQSKSLYSLAKILKSHDLSIVTFTGYEYDFIKSVNSYDWNNLLSVSDILIAGKFIYEKRCSDRLWVGSSNQEVHFLSDIYEGYDLSDKKNKIEIRLSHNGRIIVNGMADNEKILELFSDCNLI